MRYPPPQPGRYHGHGKDKSIYTILAVFQDRPATATFVRTRTYVVWKNENTWTPKCERLLIAREYIDFKNPVANP